MVAKKEKVTTTKGTKKKKEEAEVIVASSEDGVSEIRDDDESVIVGGGDPVVDPVQQNQPMYFERTEIPFEQILLHPDFPNCRRSYPAVDDLANSILENGLQNPVMVWEVTPEKPVKVPWGMVDKYHVLISGFRRYQAIQQIRVEHTTLFEEIPVHIFRGDRKEAITLSLTENIQREDPNAIELGQMFHELVNKHKMSQTEIATQVGKSDAYVSQIIKFHRGTDITPQLRELVESNQVNVWLALEIAKQPLEKQIEFIERLKDAIENKAAPAVVSKIKAEIKQNKPTPKKKLRSHKEVQEMFDKLLLSDLEALTDEDKLHVSGILKSLYWMLNNDVQWEDSSLIGWGLPASEFDDAEIRNGGKRDS